MKAKLLILAVFLISCDSSVDNELNDPVYPQSSEDWTAGSPIEYVSYQEEGETGLIVHKNYLKAEYHGNNWNSLISKNFGPFQPVDTIQFSLRAAMSGQCESMQLVTKLIGPGGVMDKLEVEIVETSKWFHIVSDGVGHRSSSSLALQIDYKGNNCTDGALLIDSVQLGPKL